MTKHRTCYSNPSRSKERTFGKVHPSVASTLNELGSVALQEDKYDAAEQYFERMADIYRTDYGEQHYLYATALSNLASVYTAQQQWTRAENSTARQFPFTWIRNRPRISTPASRGLSWQNSIAAASLCGSGS